MSVRMLVAIGLRFLAVSLCLSTLANLVYAGALRAHGPGAAEPMLALAFAAVMAVAVVLWMAARPLSAFFLSGLPREAMGGLRVADLVVAGCALMALWWLKTALVDLVELWVHAQRLAQVSGRSAWGSLDANAQAIGIARLFELLVGSLVLARAQQIGRWVLRTPAMEAPRDGA
jgi:hypothetical protein